MKNCNILIPNILKGFLSKIAERILSKIAERIKK